MCNCECERVFPLGSLIYLLMASVVLRLASLRPALLFPTRVEPVFPLLLCYTSVCCVCMCARLCVLWFGEGCKGEWHSLCPEWIYRWWNMERKGMHKMIIRQSLSNIKTKGDWAIVCIYLHKSWLECWIFSKSSDFEMRISDCTLWSWLTLSLLLSF